MRIKSRLLFVVLAVALLAAACGNSSGSSDDPSNNKGSSAPAASGERSTFVKISGVPGVSDTTIKYAAIGTKANNPLGTCILDCYVAGVKAYFAYQNDQGGIYGRKLELDPVIDDELSKNQEKSLEVSADNAAFGVFVGTLVASGFKTLGTAGIPTYVWGIHATEANNQKAIFGHTPVGCVTCISRSTPYMVKQAGATKVAVLGYGISANSKTCANTQRASIDKYSSDIGGAQVVYFNDTIDFGMPNGIAPEVTAMKAAGVQYISTCLDLNGMKTIALELQRQGMDNVVMIHPNTYSQAFVTAAGNVFEGDYVTVGFRPFEATNLEAQKNFKEYMAKAGAEISELAMVGWINATTAFAGLLAAGPDFNRQKVIDATNALTDFTADGLIASIDWTRGHVPPPADNRSAGQAQECFAPVKIVNGKFQTVNSADKPFLCWSNQSDAWAEPVQTSFK